jgi:hypothetical protein
MRVEFTVLGRPPKKHGEKSMWARRDEAPFVASLRKEAFEARLKTGLTNPFHSWVALELQVSVPETQLESIGDLDSFIAGVCDSLQAADSKVLPYLHETLRKLKEEAHPKYALLIANDAKVVSIIARKVALKKNQRVYYKITIEPLYEDIVKASIS